MTYTIRSIDEETTCTQCGMPLYEGDTVHEIDGLPFCTEACQTRHLRDRQRKEEARQRQNAARRAISAAYRDAGMVRVTGNLGGCYWE